MTDRSQRQPQPSLIPDAGYDEAPSADSVNRERHNNNPFYYANSCLGFFPTEPLDFHDFAKGQLMALAIFVPASISLFIFLAL